MGKGYTNSGSSGLRVATGSFTRASQDETEITIQGIGFTPKYMYVFKSSNSSWDSLKVNLKRIGQIITSPVFGGSTYDKCLLSEIAWHENGQGQSEETINNSGATITVAGGSATITLSTIDTLNKQGYFGAYAYNWLAIG